MTRQLKPVFNCDTSKHCREQLASCYASKSAFDSQRKEIADEAKQEVLSSLGDLAVMQNPTWSSQRQRKLMTDLYTGLAEDAYLRELDFVSVVRCSDPTLILHRCTAQVVTVVR